MEAKNYSEHLFSTLEKFHEVVDEASRQLTEIHQSRLHCKKGCFSCCIDNLEVFGIEAENIRRKYPEVVKTAPHAKGMCAFLDDEGACRVYNARPFICRTHGLPLRTVEEESDGWAEYRDICELNAEGEPLENINEKKFFFTTPFENKLVEIQIAADHGERHRMKLRDLFE